MYTICEGMSYLFQVCAIKIHQTDSFHIPDGAPSPLRNAQKDNLCKISPTLTAKGGEGFLACELCLHSEYVTEVRVVKMAKYQNLYTFKERL